MSYIPSGSSSESSRRLIPVPRVSQESGRRVVWLDGEQDVATTGVLHALLSTEVATGATDIVVDLGTVTFIDAATLGELMATRSQLRRQGGSLSLRAPSRCVRRLLDVCTLGYLLDAPLESTPL